MTGCKIVKILIRFKIYYSLFFRFSKQTTAPLTENKELKLSYKNNRKEEPAGLNLLKGTRLINKSLTCSGAVLFSYQILY